MKIFLIGNYPLLGTTSMYLYLDLLKRIIKNKGHKVEILKPKVVLNKYDFKLKIIKKYLGYIDNYIIFGFRLLNKIKEDDIVHVCDQANSILFPFLKTKKLIFTCHDLLNVKLINNNKLKKISITGNLYQRLILFPISDISSVNLNFTLCASTCKFFCFCNNKY